MPRGKFQKAGNRWLVNWGRYRDRRRPRPFPLPLPQPLGTEGVGRPDITVLIPAYQHEAFIEESLRSILAQTYNDYEIMVVDDGSSDGTAERARSFQDPRITVKVNQRNLGLGNSILGAIAEIGTPFVALLNSDDLFHPERLARCREVLLQWPEAQLVTTGVCLIDANGGCLTRNNVSRIRDGKDIYYRVHWFEGVQRPPDDDEPIFGRLLAHNYLATSSNVFCRTDFLRQQSEALKNLKYCVDWQLFLNASADGRLKYLSDELLAYRLHSSNTVWFSAENRWSYFLEVNRVIAGAIKNFLSSVPWAEITDTELEMVLTPLVLRLGANPEVDGLTLWLSGIFPVGHLQKASERSSKIQSLVERLSAQRRIAQRRRDKLWPVMELVELIRMAKRKRAFQDSPVLCRSSKKPSGAVSVENSQDSVASVGLQAETPMSEPVNKLSRRRELHDDQDAAAMTSMPAAEVQGVDAVGFAVGDLGQQLAVKEEEISQLRAALASKEQALLQRDSLLQQMAREKEQLRQMTRHSDRSLILPLVKKFHEMELKLLPPGTSRGDAYYLFWESLKKSIFEGWSRFRVDGSDRIQYLKVGTVKGRRSPSGFPPDFVVAAPEVSIIIPVFNNSSYTSQCLQSIFENTPSEIYEIIVVDNASTDDTQAVLKNFKNIKVVTNADNLGFVDACNGGAVDARGKYLLFLNNDTLVTTGWLGAMLSVFQRDEKVGAVGAKLVYPDGKLQEAGGIIWRDGTGWNYGKGNDPNRPEYNYVKEVDYCSGACLMVKADLFRDVGFFDGRYAPCFFEDTDLAFSIRDRGYKVIYQPKAVVIHYEGVTAGKNVTTGFKQYQVANRSKFVEKWRRVLDAQHFAPAQDLSDPIAIFARERGVHKRILIVDHYVPEYDKDSGSLRMYEYIRALVELGHKIVFLPDNRFRSLPYTEVVQQLGVEVIYGHINFEQYIAEYGKYFHVAYLSRPHIAIKYLDIIKERTSLYTIYDTVDLRYVRERRKAQLEGDERSLQNTEGLRRTELYLAAQSDMTLVVSDVEKDTLQRENAALNVRVVPHVYRPPKAVPAHQDRHGVLFIGSFSHTPNVDGIRWFAEAIWPKVRESFGPVKLFVVGSNPTKEVMQLNSESIIVTGFLEDVRQVFTSCRIFVAPLRYGAGVKGKILQAMSYGLPIVTTLTGAEGLPLEHENNALIAHDEEQFATEVTRLYQNGVLWQKISANSLAYMKTHHTPEACKKVFADILAAADRSSV